MRLNGSVLQPTGDVSLTADAVRLSGRDAGAIVAHARAEQGQVRFDLATPRFNADATGTIAAESPWPYTVNVTANGTDVVHALTLAGVNPETLAGTSGSAVRIGSGPREPRRAVILKRDDGCTGTRRAGAWAADCAGSPHTSRLRR